MCIKPYRGWLCGHRDPSATEFPTEPCGPPGRYYHEPFCSPPTYQLVVRKVPEYDAKDEEDVKAPETMWDDLGCTACREACAQLDQQWVDRSTEVLDEREATEKDVNGIHDQIQEDRNRVFMKGQASGPDHTVHLEYEIGQNSILQEMERMIIFVQDARDYFRENYRSIKSQRVLPEDTLSEYWRRYIRAKRRRKALNREEVVKFRRLLIRYVRELEARVVRRRQEAEADEPNGEAEAGEPNDETEAHDPNETETDVPNSESEAEEPTGEAE